MTAVLPDVDVERAYRIGSGPATFSTCTALAPAVTYNADVNGYYRALGVDPRAGKRELREAYQRLDGQDSDYLTMVLSALLNPQTRAFYDRMRLGQTLQDRYVLAANRRMLREQIRPDQLDSFLEFERNYFARQDEQNASDFLDEPSPSRQDGRTRSQAAYPYSYYCYRSDHWDPSFLPEWQTLLIGACRARGIELSFALGFHGSGSYPWQIQVVGQHIVVFFHEKVRPHRQHAEEATAYITYLQETTA